MDASNVTTNFFVLSTVRSTFSHETAQNAVVMGRKTWMSIPKKFRPLPNRLNIVLSRSADVRTICELPKEVLSANSFDNALDQLAPLRLSGEIADVFAIGGASVYKAALDSGSCETVYVTRVEKEVECTLGFLNIRAPAVDVVFFCNAGAVRFDLCAPFFPFSLLCFLIMVEDVFFSKTG